MSLLDYWLQPLRAYPRELVLVCVAISLAGGLWAMAKLAKWSVYAFALGLFVIMTGAVSLWLWQ